MMATRLTHGRRRLVAVLLAILGVAAVGGTALAGHLADGVKSYTGCLAAKGGTLTLIQEGEAPQRTCPSGSVAAHFSGGDITKISVTGGLTGGGDNGEVTIGLKPEFSLPSDCSNGNVAKWNSTDEKWECKLDNDTQYFAGTGLDVTASGIFSVEPGYRVKNTPDCGSGQFATGFDSDGDIQCSAPAAATLQAFSGPQSSFDAGVGIPDDGAFHVMASVNVPAGNYFITAKGMITSAGNVDDFSSTECQLQSGAIVYDSMRWGSVTIDDNPATTLALAGLGHSDGGTIDLACAADSGADDVGLRHGRLVVLKVG
jgi:hypothetical protein